MKLGVCSVVLFPVISENNKDEEGSFALNDSGIMYEAIRNIKNKFPESKVKSVGLFGNQDLSEIDGILDETDLDMIQLCGDRDFDVSIPSIRQIRIRESDSSDQILDYVQKALLVHNYVVLDSYHDKKLGGTGNKFDWNKAKNVIGLTNVLVSGGLDIKNIESLIKDFSPYGVDTSSGVETNGVKDIEKIKKFLELSKKKSIPELNVKIHPTSENMNEQNKLKSKLESIISNYSDRFSKNKKNRLSIVVGLTSSVVEILEHNIKVLHISSEPIFECYNQIFWPSIQTTQINKYIFSYKMIKKNNSLRFGGKKNQLKKYC